MMLLLHSMQSNVMRRLGWSHGGLPVKNTCLHAGRSVTICSPKASLSQGREWEMEGKGTPELTDAYLLTYGSGGKGD
jgi:hypothetical protein